MFLKPLALAANALDRSRRDDLADAVTQVLTSWSRQIVAARGDFPRYEPEDRLIYPGTPVHDDWLGANNPLALGEPKNVEYLTSVRKKKPEDYTNEVPIGSELDDDFLTLRSPVKKVPAPFIADSFMTRGEQEVHAGNAFDTYDSAGDRGDFLINHLTGTRGPNREMHYRRDMEPHYWGANMGGLKGKYLALHEPQMHELDAAIKTGDPGKIRSPLTVGDKVYSPEELQNIFVTKGAETAYQLYIRRFYAPLVKDLRAA